jgi:hypothetical protein
VRVGGDQADTGEAAGEQVAEERQPPAAVLTRGDLDTEDLAVGVDYDHPPPTTRRCSVWDAE